MHTDLYQLLLTMRWQSGEQHAEIISCQQLADGRHLMSHRRGPEQTLLS